MDTIKGGLEKAGEPFQATTGVNPATLGYQLGRDVIGPALDQQASWALASFLANLTILLAASLRLTTTE